MPTTIRLRKQPFPLKGSRWLWRFCFGLQSSSSPAAASFSDPRLDDHPPSITLISIVIPKHYEPPINTYQLLNSWFNGYFCWLRIRLLTTTHFLTGGTFSTAAPVTRWVTKLLPGWPCPRSPKCGQDRTGSNFVTVDPSPGKYFHAIYLLRDYHVVSEIVVLYNMIFLETCLETNLWL